MSKNRLLTIFTLMVTLLLGIVSVLAWYVTNPSVYADGMTVGTDGKGYTLELEKGEYDSTNSKWTWTSTKSLAFSNIAPGDIFFFRMNIIQNDPTFSGSIGFNDIKTTLLEDTLVVETVNGVKYVSMVQGNYNIQLYQIEDNKVTVQDKVLYDCTGGKVNLDDYLIEDVFHFYSFGNTAPTNKSLAGSSDRGTLKTMGTVNCTVTKENPYYYFAIEFNEADSLVDIFNNGKLTSNCYLYQKLKIGAISVAQSK